MVDAREPEMTTTGHIRVARMDVATLLQSLQVSDKVDGTVGGQADWRTQGNSWDGLAAALDGTLGLVMEQGVIRSRWLNLLALDLSDLLTPWVTQDDTATINCFIGKFDATEGTLTTETLLLSTPQVDITGEGGINLAAEEVDLTLRAYPQDGAVGKPAVPIHLHGPLTAPKAASDLSAAAKAGAAIALGTLVNPLAALLPLIELGSGQENACEDALSRATTGALNPPSSPGGSKSGGR